MNGERMEGTATKDSEGPSLAHPTADALGHSDRTHSHGFVEQIRTAASDDVISPVEYQR